MTSDKRRKDLMGRRFGNWTALHLDDSKRDGKGRWVCQCDCDTIRVVLRASLLNSRSRSCGCANRYSGTKGLRYRNILVDSSHPIVLGRKEHHYYPGQVLVGEHRVLLFDSIGLGPHLCHWCDCLIDWAVPWKGTGDVKKLTVDHLDNDGHNNSIDNLVPSCHSCNTHRDSGPAIFPPTAGKGKRGQGNGRSVVTESQVQEMRRLYFEGVKQCKLTEIFGLKKAQVSKIVNRTSWSHIK